MRTFALAALVLLAGPAMAQGKFKLDGFYVGGGGAFIDSNLRDDSSTDDESDDVSFSAIELISGYKINGFLSFEARLGTGLGKKDRTTIDPVLDSDGNATVDANGDPITLTARLEDSIQYYGSVYWRPETANQTAKIYGLLGLTTISVKEESSAGSDSVSESGVSFGGGVGFRFDERWNLNFEYRSLINTGAFEFNTISANLDYRF